MKEQKPGKLKRFARWLFDLDGPSPAFLGREGEDADALSEVRPLDSRSAGLSEGLYRPLRDPHAAAGKWDKTWVGIVVGSVAYVAGTLIAFGSQVHQWGVEALAVYVLAGPWIGALVLMLLGSRRALPVCIITAITLLVPYILVCGGVTAAVYFS